MKVTYSEIFARPIAIALEGPTSNLFIISIMDHIYLTGFLKVILEKNSVANKIRKENFGDLPTIIIPPIFTAIQ